ncbi:37S ribosomal protein S26 [Escovopsis weberi]|uniref:37S ribosomal protein S26 n=1 Tax=Escovopsis weberi TaxID=150374 RepID=A0A0N0RTB4_ESCWE|nr:37S ribosomal protein S26 [Escovopsis weberi]
MFSTRLRLPRTSAALSLRLGLRPAAVHSRRSLHSVPELPHSSYSKDGIPNLMSPDGFKLAWTDYMTFTLDKLNALVVGTELEDKTPKSIALMTAREPSQAAIFNYASMAHNNHFFFANIHPTGTPMPDALRRDLEASFSSIETLRREFILTAGAMFGPGFLWLVKAGPGQYRFLTTYLAGSPYPGAHWRAQAVDMNALGNQGSATAQMRSQVLGGRARGAGSSQAELPPGGVDLRPLLCLNTWEHAWLMDWGIGAKGSGGKVAFAAAWWDHIDWEKVAADSGIERGKYL